MDPNQPVRRPDQFNEPEQSPPISPAAAPAESSPVQQPTPPSQPAPYVNETVPPSTVGEPSAPTMPAENVGPQVDSFASSQSQLPQSEYAGGNINGQSLYAGGPGNDVPPKRRSHKKFWIAGGLVLLVILAAAGWVFGYYLPNKPENVWKTGLSRSGEAFEKITGSATDAKELDALQSTSMSGDVSFTSGDVNAKGTFTAKGDDANASGGFTVSLKAEGQQEYNVSADMISKMAPNATYPNLYFKLGGFKDLGLDALVPNINNYDGKWIYVSSSYLQKIADSTATDSVPKNEEQIKSKDVSELVQNVTKTTREYVFTADTGKAILVNKQFIGKEKQDGLTTYHYKVGVNSQHAKAYCAALWNGIATTQVYKKMVNEKDRTEQKDSLIKDCQKSASETKSSDQFDMWIDGHYKLIHKARFTDDSNKGSYADIGQTYKGGDTVDLFATIHDATNKIDATWTQTTNATTHEATGRIHVVSKASSDDYTVDAHYKLKMDKQKVQIPTPADATPLNDVLKKLGFPTEPDTGLPTGLQSF